MPELDLDLPDVWERQPDEDAEEHRAFVYFREQDPPLSVEEACGKFLGRHPEPEELARWMEWAREWHWEERAARYRTSVEAAAARARELTKRWERASEFYQQHSEKPRGFAKLLHALRLRRRPQSGKRESGLARWWKEWQHRRRLAAREARLKRSAKRKRPLAERWSLFLRRLRGARAEGEKGGLLAAVRERLQPISKLASKYPRRFLAVYTVLCLLVGALGGMLFLRQRRIAYQHAVIIAVNGEEIRRDEFTKLMENAAGRSVVLGLIDRSIRRQFARSKKAMPSEAEVQERYKEDSSDPNFEKALANAKMNKEDYLEMVRDELAQANLVSEGVTVTDADVRDYYQRNIDPKNPTARFYSPEMIQVAVIGTKTRAQCEKALAELQRGAAWEDVARLYSVDVSAASGGLLPPFAKGRTMASMIPGMEATIFALDPGQRVGPVKFGDGWWIIQCREKWPERLQPFEAVKLKARTWARLEKGALKNGRRIANELLAFQKAAKIQFFDPFVRALVSR